ncbi:MAG TPA: NUDIX domain-containing protein [Caulobacterales bacterium]|nr:NUDIX domain-containing protein [Caulobacterales bacterium]
MSGPVPCVGVVCLRGDDVLLIRRGAAPMASAWSIPGGRIEWGEAARAAALRELREETGVEADLVGLIEVFDGLFAQAGVLTHHYVIAEFAARWRSGEPQAGDDAADARFVNLADIDKLDLTADLKRVIRAGAALASCPPPAP